MSPIAKFAIFYGVAGVIIGAVVAAMDLKVTLQDKPARYPRLTAFIACGIAWPVIAWQIIFKG